ncbi:unnamed protein product [Allacma fusca]|uniref:Uncharacterized protein n=1 Tax=Allacma fusca TaxID=39272 RepID=A0A8J2PL75_9HEXA|nr:unnamed protein product [Allacma fusca]
MKNLVLPERQKILQVNWTTYLKTEGCRKEIKPFENLQFVCLWEPLLSRTDALDKIRSPVNGTSLDPTLQERIDLAREDFGSNCHSMSSVASNAG